MAQELIKTEALPPTSFEWPTWLVGILVYGLWALLTFFYEAMPLLLLFFLGAFIVALHGSFQHEVVHGHPTKIPWLNAVFASLPLGLCVPYGVYKESHLKHHRSELLSHPVNDPESFFIEVAAWRRMGRLRRGYFWALHSLAGRFVLGPIHQTIVLLKTELPKLARLEPYALKTWIAHGVGSAVLLFWVLVVAQMPLWMYLLCFVYAGTALGLLRSYLEHQPAQREAHRTAIVEASAPWALLFLNNNLHVVHHTFPRMPWYNIPSFYAEHRAQILRDNGNYFFAGYVQVFRRFLFKAKSAPYFPEGLG